MLIRSQDKSILLNFRIKAGILGNSITEMKA